MGELHRPSVHAATRTFAKTPCIPCIPCTGPHESMMFRKAATPMDTAHTTSSECFVVKLRQLFDEANQTWIDTYQALGIEGTPIEVHVPREDQSVGAVTRHLLAGGAKLGPINNLSEVLSNAIKTDAPVMRRAARAGWRDTERVYVSLQGVVGQPKSGITVIPPEHKMSIAAGSLRTKGSLRDWKKMASVGKHSTAITVSLCAAFAALLLKDARRPSFAIVFYGPSRSGKSLSQLVAASVIGFGVEEEMPSLGGTPAGLLDLAMTFNDSMLPVNEVATTRGPKRDIYVSLRDNTYALLSGQDIIRHPSWTGGGGGSGTFRVILVLSSEHSPDAWAARNGQIRDVGETARLIGVPALYGDHTTVFDHPPEELCGADLAKWERKQFRSLRRAIPKFRGVALRRYAAYLVKRKDHFPRETREIIRYFELRFDDASLTPVARDIIAKFGVLLAGGIFGLEAGILPIPRESIESAVERSCRAALAGLPDPDADLRADLAILKDRLCGGGILDFDAMTRKEQQMMRSADGFKERNMKMEIFIVRAQVLLGWFSSPLRVRRVLEWLDDAGFLDHTRGRTDGRSNEWAQQQITWPDGSRQRSIKICLTSGMQALEFKVIRQNG